MGNLQLGLSFIMPVLTLVIGFLLNKQIPEIWRSIDTELNPRSRLITKFLIAIIFGGLVLVMALFIITGVFISGIPDLPTAQPVNVSINVNSSNCDVNIAKVDCTPSFSCEKYCPCQNISHPVVIKNMNQSCNQTKIYRPIILSLPNNRSLSKFYLEVCHADMK
jgi:hypothetical protein